MEVKKVYLKTEHGYIFHAKLYNSDDYTYFGCKIWRALCKTYAFEPDMVATFDIRPEDDIEGNIDIWVDVQTPPVLPFGEFFSTMHAYVYVFRTVYSKIVDNYFVLSAYFGSSKHVRRLVDRTYYCPGAQLNCEEISHYVSWLEDLHIIKTNFLPELRNVSTQNVRPIVMVLNYGHIYLGMMVRFLLFVLSASFAYIIFLLNFHC